MISIILPAFNEEKAIGGVIDDIHSVLKAIQCQYEIIVIDDGSTDDTYDIALAKNTVVLKHTKNMGTGAARKTGIRQAKGDIIIMLDADGTYPAKNIPGLLKFLPQYDQVIGVRKVEYGNLKLLRLFIKRAITKGANFLTGSDIQDINSGFRAFKKDLALNHINLIPDGFSCVSTLTLIFVCNKYKVKFLPIDYYRRIGKSKFNPIKDTFIAVFTILRTILYFRFFSKA